MTYAIIDIQDIVLNVMATLFVGGFGIAYIILLFRGAWKM